MLHRAIRALLFWHSLCPIGYVHVDPVLGPDPMMNLKSNGDAECGSPLPISGEDFSKLTYIYVSYVHRPVVFESRG